MENRIDNLSDQVSQYHNRSEALDYVERAIGKKEMEQIIRKEMKREETASLDYKRSTSQRLL